MIRIPTPAPPTSRARQSGNALVRLLLLLVLLAIVAVVAWAGYRYHTFTHTPLTTATHSPTLEIARGEGFNDIVRQLREEQLTDAPPLLWRALALRMGVTRKLHAGEYALEPGMTPPTLLQNMAEGKVLHRRVTLVDGWTFAQVIAALDAAPKLDHTPRKALEDTLMKRVGRTGPGALEGQFMPDTYDYVRGMSDLDVLERAHKAMRQYLAKEWAARDPSIPLETPYQALILASLVEKETAVPAELPKIAGVFERRLKIGMKLDTDPAVIYGMGAKYAGKIHKSDLEADTPWNTYVHAGLPPTPIALPGRAAIHAVMHPAAGNALYFVAKGDGTHKFSATLAEHNAAVRKYIFGKKHR